VSLQAGNFTTLTVSACSIDSVVTSLFDTDPTACDLNGDGVLSAADLTAAILSLANPPKTSTPSPSAPPTLQAPSPTAPSPAWTFTNVTKQAGLSRPDSLSGSVAAGDYDGDGWTDLYMVRLAFSPPCNVQSQLTQSTRSGTSLGRSDLFFHNLL